MRLDENRTEADVNQEFILGKLSEIMEWGATEPEREFAWLRLMSRIKYDGYQDFLAGVRFIESLADWLQHSTRPRGGGIRVRPESLGVHRPAEMFHLVELLYPETVQWMSDTGVAELEHPPVPRLGRPEGLRLYDSLLRKTLFIELSDGARIDVFRRANAGSSATSRS